LCISMRNEVANQGYINTAFVWLSRLLRRIPQVKGLGRVVSAMNQFFLRLGIAPVVITRMQNGTSMQIDLRSHTEYRAHYSGSYDVHLLNTVISVLEPNDVFVDVGANIGFYSVAIANYFSQQRAGGKVVAFEPLGTNYQRLLSNLDLNDLQSWCAVYQLGLSSQSGEADIVKREDFSSGATTGNASIAIDKDFDAGFESELIQLNTLDAVCDELLIDRPRIEFVKVDIEGHEDLFLEGANRTLNEHRPTLLMEVNKPYYDVRQVDFDPRFTALLPADYHKYAYRQGFWKELDSFRDCMAIDNVLLIPAEKVVLEKYRRVLGGWEKKPHLTSGYQ
jgi:FkbM family methyltransferase